MYNNTETYKFLFEKIQIFWSNFNATLRCIVMSLCEYLSRLLSLLLYIFLLFLSLSFFIYIYTICPRSRDPFYVVSYYIKRVTQYMSLYISILSLFLSAIILLIVPETNFRLSVSLSLNLYLSLNFYLTLSLSLSPTFSLSLFPTILSLLVYVTVDSSSYLNILRTLFCLALWRLSFGFYFCLSFCRSFSLYLSPLSMFFFFSRLSLFLIFFI